MLLFLGEFCQSKLVLNGAKIIKNDRTENAGLLRHKPESGKIKKETYMALSFEKRIILVKLSRINNNL